MKNIFYKNAFSLLELIIATALVSVVVLGIFAVNGVLSGNNQDFGQRYLVRSATQTTLNHILNNASLAIGSGTTVGTTSTSLNVLNPLDIGILVGSQGDFKTPGNLIPNTFCIHQDIPVPADWTVVSTVDNVQPNAQPSTPPYYSNNNTSVLSGTRWLCYTWYPPGYSSQQTQSNNQVIQLGNQIWYCALPYDQNVLDFGATECNGYTNGYNNTEYYLGTASAVPTVSFITTPGNPKAGKFAITIKNCLDDSSTGTCSSGDTTDPANNPEVTVSGSTIPTQEGLPQS